MYDRNYAREIAIAESKIPKDKLNWIKNNGAWIVTEVDKHQFGILKTIRDNALSFVNNGRSVFIYSENAGNGKTTWASEIALSYIDQFIASKPDDTEGCPIPKVLFVNVPEYLMKKRMAITDKNLSAELNKFDERIRRASLVIWDDVASKGFTENEDMMLYLLLNSRIEHNKANIYTSNVLTGDLTKYVSGTVASRMMNSDENCVHIEGTGKRGMKGI